MNAEGGARLFSGMPGVMSRSNEQILKKRVLHMYTRKHFCAAGEMGSRYRLLRGVVGSPFWGVFNICLDMGLGTSLGLPCLRRDWTRWPPRVPSNLHHSVIKLKVGQKKKKKNSLVL